MSRLNSVSGRDCIRALERAGFVLKRQKGCHVIMGKAGHRVIVPNHKQLKIGTLYSILDQAGLTAEEFIDLL